MSDGPLPASGKMPAPPPYPSGKPYRPTWGEAIRTTREAIGNLFGSEASRTRVTVAGLKSVIERGDVTGELAREAARRKAVGSPGVQVPPQRVINQLDELHATVGRFIKSAPKQAEAAGLTAEFAWAPKMSEMPASDRAKFDKALAGPARSAIEQQLAKVNVLKQTAEPATRAMLADLGLTQKVTPEQVKELEAAHVRAHEQEAAALKSLLANADHVTRGEFLELQTAAMSSKLSTWGALSERATKAVR